MERFEPFQFWLLMAAVAYISFLVGRASVNMTGERRKENRNSEREQE